MKRTTPTAQERQLQLFQRLQILQTMAIAGGVTGRAALMERMGKQYSDDRKIYRALGYPTDISFKDFVAKYVRQDIAKAIIDRPVSHTWKGDVELIDGDDDQETDFEKTWKRLYKRLRLKSKFVRLDKLSSLGEYGVFLFGFSDLGGEAEDWSVEVNEGVELLYIKPLGQGNAVVKNYVNDPSDERYGLPYSYDVVLTNPGTGKESSMVVHHSRIMHVAPEVLEDEVLGLPRLQVVYNRLMDLEKVVGGSAEMFWRGARPGYQGKIDPEFTLTTDEEDELKSQIDEYEHDLRRLLVNKGIEWGSLEMQVADPSKHIDVIIQMISATTGIPKRILTGSERGELSSEQDITSWNSYIQTRREEHAEEVLIRPFVDRMIEYGVLPTPTEGNEEDGWEYSVRWQDLTAVSDKDQAEVGRIRAEALQKYTSNAVAEAIVSPTAFMKFMMGLTDDEIDEIQSMMGDPIQEELESRREEQREQAEQIRQGATTPTNGQPQTVDNGNNEE